MTAAADAPRPSRPIYVLLLEQTIRELDRVISGNMPPIRGDHPEDHGLRTEVAELVESLRHD